MAGKFTASGSQRRNPPGTGNRQWTCRDSAGPRLAGSRLPGRAHPRPTELPPCPDCTRWGCPAHPHLPAAPPVLDRRGGLPSFRRANRMDGHPARIRRPSLRFASGRFGWICHLRRGRPDSRRRTRGVPWRGAVGAGCWNLGCAGTDRPAAADGWTGQSGRWPPQDHYREPPPAHGRNSCCGSGSYRREPRCPPRSWHRAGQLVQPGRGPQPGGPAGDAAVGPAPASREIASPPAYASPGQSGDAGEQPSRRRGITRSGRYPAGRLEA